MIQGSLKSTSAQIYEGQKGYSIILKDLNSVQAQMMNILIRRSKISNSVMVPFLPNPAPAPILFNKDRKVMQQQALCVSIIENMLLARPGTSFKMHGIDSAFEEHDNIIIRCKGFNAKVSVMNELKQLTLCIQSTISPKSDSQYVTVTGPNKLAFMECYQVHRSKQHRLAC